MFNKINICKAIRKLCLTLLGSLIISLSTSFSQWLDITINGYENDRVWLYSYYGDEMRLEDSLSVLDGRILQNLQEKYAPGVYHIYFKDPRRSGLVDREIRGVDIIIDEGEDIKMITNIVLPANDMIVEQSVSNQAYYSFLNLHTVYTKKLGYLVNLVPLYEKKNDFYNALIEELTHVQESYNDSLMALTKINPGSFISDLLKLNIEPVFPLENIDNPAVYMKDNYLIHINLNNEYLINSQYLTKKILTYLSFYKINEGSFEDQQNEYMVAVDRIMEEAQYNQIVHDFVLYFLIDVFERIGMENVLIHLADNYMTEECETDNEKIIKERIQAFKNMSVGNKVKDIRLLDQNDKPQNLVRMEPEYILLVFWATWCPHCTSLLPRINSWYIDNVDQDKLGIFMVALDSVKADWEEFVFLNDLKGIQVIDMDGWEGKNARNYNLYATPSVFILNRNLEIVAKPITMREIRKEYEKILKK